MITVYFYSSKNWKRLAGMKNLSAEIIENYLNNCPTSRYSRSPRRGAAPLSFSLCMLNKD
jgi:hypothetical protein